MRKLLCFCIFFPVLSIATAQVPAAKKYDSKKLHLLIYLSGSNFHSNNQGLIDLDSAMDIACQAQNASRLLVFDENLQAGLSTPGRIALENNDPAYADALLSKLKNKEQQDLLLLELAGFYLFKPGTKKRDLDKAFNYLSRAKTLSDSLRLVKYQHETLNLLGKYYAEEGKNEQSIACFTRVLNAATNSGDKFETAGALANLATYLPLQNPEKLLDLEKALALYKSINAKEKAIETLSKLSTTHFWLGQIDACKKDLFQLLEVQRAAGFLHTQYTHTVLSYINNVEGQKEKALFHAIEAVNTMESTRDTVLARYFYFRLGGIYDHMGAYENAIQLHLKVMKASEKRDQILWYKGFYSITEILNLQKKYNESLNFIQSSIKKFPPTLLFDKMIVAELMGTCYENLNNKVLADWHFNEMIRYADQIHSDHMNQDVARVYVLAASHFVKQNNFTLAKHYLEKSRLVSSSQYNVELEQIISKIQFKIDSASGRYLDAIGAYQTYMRIDDSLYNEKKDRQIQELQIQYETKKKEQDIKLLNSEKLLQQDRLKQADTTKNLILAVVFALLLIVGLLYNRYRFKEKSNSLLESQKQEISTKNISLENLLNEKEQILVEKDKLIVEKQELIEEKEGLLDDKEWLLKEIHHRVKNNLQIVMSLLGSQSIYIGNDVALAAIRESQHRVHAISLIHQKLYQSGNMATIAMKDYIPELVSYIKDSFDIAGKICFKIEIDNILLDVAQAVPVGLILNEAITNSVKYAFPGNRKGEVNISMKRLEQENFELKFQDDGVGLPANFEIDKLNSLGMTLMKGLSKQLEGQISIESNNGLTITIHFMHDQMTPLILDRTENS